MTIFGCFFVFPSRTQGEQPRKLKDPLHTDAFFHEKSLGSRSNFSDLSYCQRPCQQQAHELIIPVSLNTDLISHYLKNETQQ